MVKNNITELDNIDISKLKKTIMWDPTQDEICGSCKFCSVVFILRDIIRGGTT